MKSNHLGNNRYYLIENACRNLGHVSRPEGMGLILDIDEEVIISKISKFMANTGNSVIRNKLIDIFGFAYITEDGYSILTLDNNNYIFIDNEYYMSSVSMNEDGEVFAYCLNHEDESRMWVEIL